MSGSAGSVQCCVVGCHSRKRPYPNLSFHRFPVDDHSKRRAWICAVKGVPDWEPPPDARVCSLHFTSGAPSTARGPDYAPRIFPADHLKPKTNQQKEGGPFR